jgi:hypothetical protein
VRAAFLVLGVLIARPSTFGRAMPFLFGICGTLALQDTNTADMPPRSPTARWRRCSAWRVAVVTTGVLRRVGAGWTARRLLKAGWGELARLGRRRVTSLPEFSARMVDRVGLLTPRLALAGRKKTCRRSGRRPARPAHRPEHDPAAGRAQPSWDAARPRCGR